MILKAKIKNEKLPFINLMTKIVELQEINKRQRLLIQMLSQAVNSPVQKEILLKQVDLAEENFSSVKNKINNIKNNMNVMKYDNLINIRNELSAKILEKSDEIAKLKANVAEYQAICEGYDQHQEKLQEEKDKLFNDFQNQPKDNTVSVSQQTASKQFSSLLSSPMKENPEDLQRQIDEADIRIKELTEEHNQLKKVLEERQKEYNDILNGIYS